MTEPKHHSENSTSSRLSANELEEAFVSMLDRNQWVLRKIASMFCQSDDDQQDLIQEIIYRAWSAFPNFRHESKESTWLFAVGTGTADRQIRKQRNWIQYTDEIFERDHPATTDDLNEMDMKTELENMRSADHEIVSLLVKGYEYHEISAQLNIDLPALRSRIQKLKKRLAKK